MLSFFFWINAPPAGSEGNNETRRDLRRNESLRPCLREWRKCLSVMTDPPQEIFSSLIRTRTDPRWSRLSIRVRIKIVCSRRRTPLNAIAGRILARFATIICHPRYQFYGPSISMHNCIVIVHSLRYCKRRTSKKRWTIADAKLPGPRDEHVSWSANFLGVLLECPETASRE